MIITTLVSNKKSHMINVTNDRQNTIYRITFKNITRLSHCFVLLWFRLLKVLCIILTLFIVNPKDLIRKIEPMFSGSKPVRTQLLFWFLQIYGRAHRIYQMAISALTIFYSSMELVLKSQLSGCISLSSVHPGCFLLPFISKSTNAKTQTRKQLQHLSLFR